MGNCVAHAYRRCWLNAWAASCPPYTAALYAEVWQCGLKRTIRERYSTGNRRVGNCVAHAYRRCWLSAWAASCAPYTAALYADVWQCGLKRTIRERYSTGNCRVGNCVAHAYRRCWLNAWAASCPPYTAALYAEVWQCGLKRTIRERYSTGNRRVGNFVAHAYRRCWLNAWAASCPPYTATPERVGDATLYWKAFRPGLPGGNYCSSRCDYFAGMIGNNK